MKERLILLTTHIIFIVFLTISVPIGLFAQIDDSKPIGSGGSTSTTTGTRGDISGSSSTITTTTIINNNSTTTVTGGIDEATKANIESLNNAVQPELNETSKQAEKVSKAERLENDSNNKIQNIFRKNIGEIFRSDSQNVKNFTENAGKGLLRCGINAGAKQLIPSGVAFLANVFNRLLGISIVGTAIFPGGTDDKGLSIKMMWENFKNDIRENCITTLKKVASAELQKTISYNIVEFVKGVRDGDPRIVTDMDKFLQDAEAANFITALKSNMAISATCNAFKDDIIRSILLDRLNTQGGVRANILSGDIRKFYEKNKADAGDCLLASTIGEENLRDFQRGVYVAKNSKDFWDAFMIYSTDKASNPFFSNNSARQIINERKKEGVEAAKVQATQNSGHLAFYSCQKYINKIVRYGNDGKPLPPEDPSGAIATPLETQAQQDNTQNTSPFYVSKASVAPNGKCIAQDGRIVGDGEVRTPANIVEKLLVEAATNDIVTNRLVDSATDIVWDWLSSGIKKIVGRNQIGVLAMNRESDFSGATTAAKLIEDSELSFAELESDLNSPQSVIDYTDGSVKTVNTPTTGSKVTDTAAIQKFFTELPGTTPSDKIESLLITENKTLAAIKALANYIDNNPFDTRPYETSCLNDVNKSSVKEFSLRLDLIKNDLLKRQQTGGYELINEKQKLVDYLEKLIKAANDAIKIDNEDPTRTAELTQDALVTLASFYNFSDKKDPTDYAQLLETLKLTRSSFENALAKCTSGQ